MGWLEELINKAIEGQDREIESARESIEWHEKGAKDGRYKRDVAQARKNELVEALAKLYPPAEPRVWQSVYDIPEGVIALEAECPCRLYARRQNGALEVATFQAPLDSDSWISLPRDHRKFLAFTEVLDGDK